MKNYLVIIIFGSMLLLTACTTANADTDLEWTHNNNHGEAKNYVAEEVNNLNHTPQEAVDKINSLYEGTVVEVELDGDDGVYYYEIEIVNGDIKYDSKVNADNLELIKLEKGDADSEEPLNSVKRITPEAALDIADGEVDGEITGWELEDDEYEILIEADDNSVVIEIDALTADVLNKEIIKNEDEKNKVDGSGGKGEESANDEEPEESVKDKDSKSEKSDEPGNGESSDEGKSEPADKKDDEQEKSASDQETEETVAEEEMSEKAKNTEQKPAEQKKEEQQSKDDSGQQKNQTSDYENGVLTPDAAINIALNAVGGIVIEWEYDDDDFEYEIELIVNGQEVEVEINSINGSIIEIDYDD